MDGKHSMPRCFEVTENVLKMLSFELYQHKVNLEGLILKPNMVVAGTASINNNTVDEVAKAIVDCLLGSVPATVPAIAFLSGGQSPEEACAHLAAINQKYKDRVPWMFIFSFARAIQQPALDIWKGKDANVPAAQTMLYQA